MSTESQDALKNILFKILYRGGSVLPMYFEGDIGHRTYC